MEVYGTTVGRYTPLSITYILYIHSTIHPDGFIGTRFFPFLRFVHDYRYIYMYKLYIDFGR